MDGQERARDEADTVVRDIERRFPAQPAAVASIRSFVRDAAGPGFADLELVASELATNAVQHGVGPVSVRVESNGDTVRISVHDCGQRYPQVTQVASDATRGRGLGIVALASSDWGVERDGEGKWVWAELSRWGD